MEPLANALFAPIPGPHAPTGARHPRANAERVRKMEPRSRGRRRADRRLHRRRTLRVHHPVRDLAAADDGLEHDRGRPGGHEGLQEVDRNIAVGLVEQLDNDQRAEVLRNVQQFENYMLPRIEERRSSPRDDLLSALVNEELDLDELEGQEIAGPRQLTNSEILSIVSQILAAGNHTTTDLLGKARCSPALEPRDDGRRQGGSRPDPQRARGVASPGCPGPVHLPDHDGGFGSARHDDSGGVDGGGGLGSRGARLRGIPRPREVRHQSRQREEAPQLRARTALLRRQQPRQGRGADRLREAADPPGRHPAGRRSPPERRDLFAFSGYEEINLEFSKSDAG